MPWFLALLLLTVTALAQSQEPPKAPEIETQQQTEGGLKTQNNGASQNPTTNPTSIIPAGHSDPGDNKPEQKPSKGSDEGTEFWPSFFGYRLKVSDTLLVGFTFLLFLVTLALWWSTRRLVRNADQTAKRQLRPYIVVKPSFGYDGKNRPLVQIIISNIGQTPALQIATFSRLDILGFF